MALPLAPVAVVALRYGAVALALYALSRRARHGGRIDQRVEDAMDELHDGLSTQRPRDRDQINATARMRRTLRLGPAGPGVEIDFASLARLRLRRV